MELNLISRCNFLANYTMANEYWSTTYVVYSKVSCKDAPFIAVISVWYFSMPLYGISSMIRGLLGGGRCTECFSCDLTYTGYAAVLSIIALHHRVTDIIMIYQHSDM